MRAPRPFLGLAALLAFALPAAEPAGAEMYRCTGPDGSPVFTSDPSRCPAAPAYRPAGEVQRVAPPAPSSRPAARRSTALVDETASRNVWQRKKLRAQNELRQAEADLEHLDRLIARCSRGADLWVEDDLGIRRGVDCNDVKAKRAQLAARVADLRHYLAEGLAEECRTAGCLPGWLRD